MWCLHSTKMLHSCKILQQDIIEALVCFLTVLRDIICEGVMDVKEFSNAACKLLNPKILNHRWQNMANICFGLRICSKIDTN